MNTHQIKTRLRAVIFAVAASSTVAAGPAFASAQSPAQQTPPVSADQAFTAFADRYFDGDFHFYPASATGEGIHSYDRELPSYSRKETEAEIGRAKQALEEFSRLPKDKLSKENRFDTRLLESSIRSEVLDLDQVRMWEKDPDFYNSQISYALYTLVERNFAPVDDRLTSLVGRLKRVPSIIANARDNLRNPPSVYVVIVTRQVAAQRDFLKNQLPQAIQSAQNATLKAEFDEANRL